MTTNRFTLRPAGRLLALLALPAALTLSGCERGDAAKADQAAPAALASPCGAVPLSLASAMPTNTGSDQASIDCAAWGAFIALNWRADPARPGYPDPKATAASFGMPGETGPSVWETYLEAKSVFAAGGGGKLQGLWRAPLCGRAA